MPRPSMGTSVIGRGDGYVVEPLMRTLVIGPQVTNMVMFHLFFQPNDWVIGNSNVSAMAYFHMIGFNQIDDW